ncbi:MAG TPA: glycosyltransferase family 9 protein [Longimicrobiales bacterium]
MTDAPERILLLQLYHLGDVILTTPTIRAARLAFPNARIDFVTNALGAQALEGNPHLNHILVKPPFWYISRTRYQAVVDLHSVPRTARTVVFTGARVRIGLRGRGPRNLAYTQLLPRENNAVYMALQKLRMLAPLGVVPEAADLALEMAIDDDKHNWARQTFAQLGLGSRVVAVSPVAKHEFKQWGAQRWARVADALADAGAQILITSGPGEEAQAEAVANAMKQHAVWRYGRTSVRQLAALYARCSLWIGNDGGPKHMAVAVHTPTVTVYRRALGGVWSDPTDPKQTAINSGQESLDTISEQQVISAGLNALEKQ